MFKKIANKTNARLNVTTLLNKIVTVHIPNFISNVLGMPSLSNKIKIWIDYFKKSIDVLDLLKESVLLSYKVFIEKRNAKKVVTSTVESVKEIISTKKSDEQLQEESEDSEIEEPENPVSGAMKHLVSNVGEAIVGSISNKNITKLKKKKSSSLINFGNKKEDE